MKSFDPQSPTLSTRRATGRRRLLVVAGTITLAFPILALASPVDVPNQFTAGDVISAEAFNENFDTLEAAVDDNDARISALEQGTADFPSGAVVFFNTATCPEGWAELQSARGRVPLGLPNGGTLAATVGTDLANEADRTISQVPSHTHAVGTLAGSTNNTGSHAHSISNTTGGHSHTIQGSGTHNHTITMGEGGGFSFRPFWAGGAGNSGSPQYTTPNGGSHTHTIGANTGTHGHSMSSDGGHAHTVTLAGSTASAGAGTVDVTMPYIQLLACQKT